MSEAWATERLEVLVRDVAANPDAWLPHVRHEADDRVCVKLRADDDVEVWLVCWSDGHDTGFHDHDDAGAAITVLQGAVTDERLALGGAPVARTYEQGATYTVAPAAIHRVRHSGPGPAVTIHAYSPPLARMGTYELAGDGTLHRLAQSADTQLVAPASL